MKKLNKVLTLTMIGATLVMTSSCARDLSGKTYVDNSTTGIVLEGTVVSARQVTVKGSDKAADGIGVGTIGGAALGGVGGHSFGKGTGNGLATVGGVLLGGLLGNVIEDKLNTSEGMEYIVKVNDDNIDDNSTDKSVTVSRSNKVKDKIVNSSKIKTKTKMISVVQGTDQIFTPGQKVYVIYNDNRPRLTPAI